MSITLCIKYAFARVTVEDVTWIFDQLFGETLVIKVNEVVKKDRDSGKDFKMFFIECDQVKQTKGKLDRLVSNIKKNLEQSDKRGARVSIDQYGHYWQVSFAIEKPKQEDFKPRIMDEAEHTVEELTAAMEALQTKTELDHLYGRKRTAEDGEITEPKRAFSGIYETVIAHDDPIIQEALLATSARFRSDLPPMPPNSKEEVHPVIMAALR